MNKIVEAAVADAADLQKLAFISEAELAGDYNIQPLTQTLEELEKEFDNNLILKYVYEDKAIGSVRAREKNGTCYVSKLMVHPDFQNRGIGKELMKAIESMFTNVRYELFTGSESKRNISFYEKIGYKSFKTERLARENTIFIFMEKLY